MAPLFSGEIYEPLEEFNFFFSVFPKQVDRSFPENVVDFQQTTSYYVSADSNSQKHTMRTLNIILFS